MDYQKWTSQAGNFLTAMKSLPGEINVSLEIAAPLTEAELAVIQSKWHRHLPRELVRFWTEGSAHLNGHYWWQPPDSEEADLARIFAHNSFIYGGPRFFAAYEVDPEPADSSWIDDFVIPDAPEDEERARDIWGRSIIFLETMSGDSLVLDAEAPECDPDDPPVVYLDHEQPGVLDQISPSFTEFLLQWEKLSYIGPDSSLLNYWLDRGAGQLSPDRYQTMELKRLLSPRP
jgi:hypothetical protein